MHLKLSTEEYWDKGYRLHKVDYLNFAATQDFLNSRFIDFSDYFLWQVILPRYLPKIPGQKVIEIGSAPGNFLIKLSKQYGYIPYGVEITDSGVALNKEVFRRFGTNPDNVIHADFMSSEFHEKYKEHFDIVVSRGFIEHFTDVHDVLAKHLSLLKKGGCLIVSIPNIRGVNRFLANFFNKDIVKIHNLSIMDAKIFSGLFENDSLKKVFCDYYGIFSSYLFNTPEGSSFSRFLLFFCRAFQRILNPILRILSERVNLNSRFFSPYLLYIGIKE